MDGRYEWGTTITYGLMSEPDPLEKTALDTYKLYKAFVKAGFTEEQALKIIIGGIK